MVYSDASCANLKDGASQRGFAIFLDDSAGKCFPSSWGSKRYKRVAKSTLRAETQSAVETLSTAYMLETMISELINDEKRLEIVLYTDS